MIIERNNKEQDLFWKVKAKLEAPFEHMSLANKASCVCPKSLLFSKGCDGKCSHFGFHIVDGHVTKA